MIGTILGILLIAFIILFSICSCVVASWAEQEMERDKKEGNEIEK